VPNAQKYATEKFKYIMGLKEVRVEIIDKLEIIILYAKCICPYCGVETMIDDKDYIHAEPVKCHKCRKIYKVMWE
jgi:hypothetical protein